MFEQNEQKKVQKKMYKKKKLDKIKKKTNFITKKKTLEVEGRHNPFQTEATSLLKVRLTIRMIQGE